MNTITIVFLVILGGIIGGRLGYIIPKYLDYLESEVRIGVLLMILLISLIILVACL